MKTLARRTNQSIDLVRSQVFSELLTDIVEKYFDTLCSEHTLLFIGSQADKQFPSFKQDTRQRITEEFTYSLNRELLRYTGEASELTLLQLASVAIEKSLSEEASIWIPKILRRDGSVDVFLEHVRAFLLKKSPLIKTPYAKPLNLFADALQETAVTIPQWLETRGEKIAPQIEQALSEVLASIHEARTQFTPQKIAQSTLQKGLINLYTVIFESENYIWLPMASPLTAPLEEKENLEKVYARDERAAKRLARQIVKGDGIILISGYRGVGKSTFLNAALQKHVPEAESDQIGNTNVKIVPIQVNVAKASNIENILRLCIRGLHRAKRDTPDIPFTAEESMLIDMANLRTTFRVNASQGELLTHAREIKTVFGFNPGTVFSGLLSHNQLLSLLPGINHIRSKAWQQNFDKSISLLDYDEDRAEEDIIRLIRLASQERMHQETPVRIKFVFVFDELDKMEARKGQDELVSRLKNLFLTPHSVFVLVTSKDFYYLLEEEKKKEDSILGSYFSSVVTVPMFTSRETEALIRNLLAIEIPSSKELDGREDISAVAKDRYVKMHEYLKLLANYLTYKSFGLPREIVRELRENQEWTRLGLQPYITDHTFDRDEVRIFGKIQDVIEQVSGADSFGEGTNTTENDVWLNEIRKEQVRRGLYVLLDELRLQIELDSNSNALQEIHKNNFKGLPYKHFLVICKTLGRKLSEISDEKGILFRLEAGATPSDFRLLVLPAFYIATKTQPSYTTGSEELSDLQQLSPEESLDQVRYWLKQGSVASQNRLSFYLRNCTKPLPMDVEEDIYKILITSSEPSDIRAEFALNITPRLFLSTKDKKTVNTFSWLVQEKDEAVVAIALDWALNNNNSALNRISTDILHNVLLRPKNTPATLTRAITGLADLTEDLNLEIFTVEFLHDVLSALDEKNDIPREILASLIKIASFARVHLLELLQSHDLPAISTDTLRIILNEDPYAEIENLWSSTLTKPDTTTKKRLLASLLIQWIEGDEIPEFIKEWLLKTEWTEAELEIVREVGKSGNRLLDTLQKRLRTRKTDTLLAAAIGMVREGSQSASVEPLPAKVKTVGESLKTETAKSKTPLLPSFIVGIILLIGIYLIPLDTDTSATLLSRAISRMAELGYMIFIALGFFAILVAAVIVTSRSAGDNKRNTSTGIVIAIGLGVLVLIFFCIGAYLFIMRLGITTMPMTFWGQVVIFVATIFSAVIIWLTAIISNALKSN